MLDTERPLTPLAEGVWVDTAPVRIVGMQLTATMTVLRLANGGLLLHSPIPTTPTRRSAIEKLGPVAHLYAPNTFHHSWIGDWAASFPTARLHAPAALARKRRDLRVDRTHGSAPEPEFDGIVDELHVDGFRLEESVIVYRPARTLVVADLVHNIGAPDGAWTKLYCKTMGFYDRIALSRVIRWTAFQDRIAARRSLDEVLERPFDRLIVGHGAPITTGAREALAGAYDWLPRR